MLSFLSWKDKHIDRNLVFQEFLIYKLVDLKIKSLMAHTSHYSFKYFNYFYFKFRIQTPSVS